MKNERVKIVDQKPATGVEILAAQKEFILQRMMTMLLTLNASAAMRNPTGSVQNATLESTHMT